LEEALEVVSRLARVRGAPDAALREASALAPSGPAVASLEGLRQSLEALACYRPDAEVVADFGLARHEELQKVTRVGYLVGTPAYMAPESLMGCEPDRRSDLYSLGVILYEIFTGRMPYDASSVTEFIDAHLNQAPLPPRRHAPALTAELEALILRLLEKHPDDRVQSADDLREGLEAVLAQVVELLRRQGRVSYRALKLRFQLDDEYVEGLKEELIYAQQLASDEEGRVLVWKGEPEQKTPTRPQEPPAQRPIVYTPRHLAERILTEQAALEARGAQDGRWEFLFVAPPLPVTAGVGSPINPYAIT
jgi:hypothetical protein